MSGTKADSWQEMQSRRLIQLPCKPRSEDKNAEPCVESTAGAPRQNLFTGLKPVHRGIALLSDVTKEKGAGKKQKRNHIKKIQKGKKISLWTSMISSGFVQLLSGLKWRV